MSDDEAAARAHALLDGNGCTSETPHLMQTSRPARAQHGAKFVALMLFASVVSLATQPAHAMKSIGKSAGPTTPYLPDFSATYANHTGHVGYGNATPHRMLIETFPTRCAPHERGVNSANFSITLQKLSVTPGPQPSLPSRPSSRAANPPQRNPRPSSRPCPPPKVSNWLPPQ